MSLKVALVDDDAAVRKALGRLLVSAGYSTLTFSSAQSFLDDPARNDIGCMVIDVKMPEISGLELQTRLAASGATLPIIFITAHDDAEVKARALAGGALVVLHKLFEDVAFLEAVGRALSKCET